MSIIKNTVSIILRDGITVILNLIISIILARSLGPDLLGIWFIFLTIFTLLDTFFRTKAETCSIYFSASGDMKIYDLERNLIIITICSILLMSITFFLGFEHIYNYFFNNVDVNYRSHLKLLLLTVSLSFIATIYFYLWLGKEKFKFYNYSILGQSIINFVLIIFLTFLYKDTVWVPLTALTCSWFFAAIFGISFFRIKKYYLNTSNDYSLKNIPILLKGSMHVYSGAIIKSFQDQLPRLVILYLFPINQLAFLGQSQLIMNLFIRFSTAVGNVLYPRLASLDEKNQVSLIMQSIRISLIINSLIIILLTLTIDFLVSLVYGDEYSTMTLYLYFMLPSSLILIQGLIMEQHINGRGDFKLKVILNLISCLGLVITLLFFYNDLENIHIAIAIAVSNILYTITACIIFIYKYNIDITKMIPKRNDFRLIINFIINFKLEKISK